MIRHISDSQPLNEAGLRRRRFVSRLAATVASLPLLPAIAGGGSRDSAALRKRFDQLLDALAGPVRLEAGLKKRLWMTLVRDEPWGAENLKRVLSAMKPDVPVMPAPASLDPAGRWYLGHVLTTLVTGIYYHERGNIAVTWDGALMYQWLADIRPIPGSCHSDFGDWSRPPAGYRDEQTR